MNPEMWSIISSIVSILIAFLAIGMSIWFFIVGRNTDKNVSNSLTEIKTQAEMLQKISGKQLDKLTKYVTEPKESPVNDQLGEMLKIVAQIPLSLSASFSESSSSNNEDVTALRTELISCYIALYFYTAHTNFWSHINLPDASKFDSENTFDAICKRIVDTSANDFFSMANILARCDPAELNGNALNHLLEETKSTWKNLVLNSSQVYENRAKSEQ